LDLLNYSLKVTLILEVDDLRDWYRGWPPLKFRPT